MIEISGSYQTGTLKSGVPPGAWDEIYRRWPFLILMKHSRSCVFCVLLETLVRHFAKERIYILLKEVKKFKHHISILASLSVTFSVCD